jgi:hypothetical protein
MQAPEVRAPPELPELLPPLLLELPLDPLLLLELPLDPPLLLELLLEPLLLLPLEPLLPPASSLAPPSVGPLLLLEHAADAAPTHTSATPYRSREFIEPLFVRYDTGVKMRDPRA